MYLSGNYEPIVIAFLLLNVVVVVVVGFKADCLTRDLGLWVECPPWGSPDPLRKTPLICQLTPAH